MTYLTTITLAKIDLVNILKEVTIEYNLSDLDNVKETSFLTTVKNIFKQDYAAMNKDFDLKQDFLSESSCKEKALFIGEVYDKQAKLFIPGPKSTKFYDFDYLLERTDPQVKKFFFRERGIEKFIL